MNSLEKMFNEIDEDKADAERRLKELCTKSTRITYEGLIKRLKDITENKLHENDFRFVSFMKSLADDLDNSIIVNEMGWDMTLEQIDEYYKDYDWQKDYDENKNYIGIESCLELYPTLKDFADSMIDWMHTYSLDCAFAVCEDEFKTLLKNV